ncbi:DUF305 domain-containing protein [Nocardia bovistercoris]|uniref:DUF305 domain-containing protein n=1 Tax=Nocardia bovistercoris TaxID=2785916 RepID=A0A931N7K6_9NOCA|nr:DUF305 domain-containing protein [Nocardia bovistercoris]MBH0781882.1 DUF305 domain-containing protein [Nocardia bovistercoris]
MITVKTTAAATLAVLATAAVLTGCSDDSSGQDTSSMTTGAAATSSSVSPSGSAVAGAHNDADVRFAQEMIPHHSQAVEMAQMVPGRSTDQQLVDLAARIQQAQGPEIATMTGWLRAWGVAVSTTSTPAMPGMDHGSRPMPGMDQSAMPGMMTSRQMAQLQGAGGAEFDRMWLTMMIEHHRGAIEMARTEVAQGSNADAKALAQKIADDQQAEITQMQAMLATR